MRRRVSIPFQPNNFVSAICLPKTGTESTTHADRRICVRCVSCMPRESLLTSAAEFLRGEGWSAPSKLLSVAPALPWAFHQWIHQISEHSPTRITHGTKSKGGLGINSRKVQYFGIEVVVHSFDTRRHIGEKGLKMYPVQMVGQTVTGRKTNNGRGKWVGSRMVVNCRRDAGD